MMRTLRWSMSIGIAVLALFFPAVSHAEHPEWLEVAADLDRVHELENGSTESVLERMGEWVDAGYGFVEVAWTSRIRIKAQSEIEARHSVVRLFVTASGAQQAGTFEVSVDTGRSRLRIERAYLLLPGGRRQAVDPDSIQIRDPLEPNLFSDTKTVSIPLAGIVPGAIGYVDYRIVRKVDADPLPWSWLSHLQSTVPILSTEIVIENERGKDWLAWETNDPELECESPTVDRLRCRRSESAPLKSDPSVRSYYDLVPHFIAAERVSWKEYAARVGGLVEGKLDVSEDMRSTIERIRSDFEGQQAQAEEIYRVVSNQVRYLGFEHGDSAVVPHAASLTWHRRFGDCKDKVTLFVAMARALGIEARPVLTSSIYFDVENAILPATSYFDHMIVCTSALVRDNGCVDVTLASSPAELPYMLQGGIALQLAGSESDAVRALPKRGVLWEVAVERDIELRCDGEVSVQTAYHQGGSWGDTVRGALIAMGPSDRSQYMLSEFSQAMGSAEARPSMKLSGLSALNEPWTVSYSSQQPRRVAMDGVQHFYDIDPWFSVFARSLVAENQHHDFDLPGIRLEAISRFDVCEDAAIGYTGAALDLEGRWGALWRRYEKDGNKLIVRSTLSMSSRSVSPAELRDLRLYLGRALNQTAIQFEYHFD